MRLLVLLLLAAPLSAQTAQTTLVPPIINEISVTPTPFVNEITVMSDSVMAERLALAIAGLTAELAAQECNQCGGTSTIVRVGQAGLLLTLGYIGYQLKRIADKEFSDSHKTIVNVPEHDDQHHEHHGHREPKP